MSKEECFETVLQFIRRHYDPDNPNSVHVAVQKWVEHGDTRNFKLSELFMDATYQTTDKDNRSEARNLTVRRCIERLFEIRDFENHEDDAEYYSVHEIEHNLNNVLSHYS